jgi:hypothetical protein
MTSRRSLLEPLNGNRSLELKVAAAECDRSALCQSLVYVQAATDSLAMAFWQLASATSTMNSFQSLLGHLHHRREVSKNILVSSGHQSRGSILHVQPSAPAGLGLCDGAMDVVPIGMRVLPAVARSFCDAALRAAAAAACLALPAPGVTATPRAAANSSSSAYKRGHEWSV